MHKNLVQSRFLFEKAQMLWEPYRDISNGLVVSLLQDSAELAVWAIVNQKSVQVKDKDGFVSILEKVGSEVGNLSGKSQVLEINKSRVAFKHYGLTPSPSDIPRFIEGARFFLTENVRLHLGQDFKTLSLADEVADAKTRNLIKEAEQYRDDGKYDEALTKISLAFQRILRLAQDSLLEGMPRFDEADSLFPRDSQEEARTLIWDIGRFLGQFLKNHAMFTLGVDRGLLEEIEARRVRVNVSVDGTTLGVSQSSRTDVTLENVNFLISNVTEIARRAD